MEQMERRTYPTKSLEVETRDDKPPIIRGHAAVFNIIADGGWFRERVAPGAFSNTIRVNDVRALWNHDSNIVLGRNRSNTLKLSEDDIGLAVEITPPDTTMARDLVASIKRGDVNQMSFGFQVKRASWVEGDDEENDLRTIEEVKLWEVSPVTFPFYEATDVSIKSSHSEWRAGLRTVTGQPHNIIRRRRLELMLRHNH